MTGPYTDIGSFPPAPKGMPKDQKTHWNAIVRSFPSDWFKPADLPLVVEMVRALSMAEALNERIQATSDLGELKTLLALRDAEARRAAALATKLRMPPQSRSDRHRAGTAARAGDGRRPWEGNVFDELDEFLVKGKQTMIRRS